MQSSLQRHGRDLAHRPPAKHRASAISSVCSGRTAVVQRQRAQKGQLLHNPQGAGRQVLCRVAEPMTRPTMSVADSSWDELFGEAPECPLGGVLSVMRANERGVMTCAPTDTCEAIVPALSKVTGLPVLGADGRVIGVISRKDIIRIRKSEGSLTDLVQAHMTTPAITIKDTASVQEAADLMLSKRIRRLPVVNELGFPVGILARSDIFKPLFVDAYTQYMLVEAAAVQGLPSWTAEPQIPVTKLKKVKKQVTWTAKYLYDGDCKMCLSLKRVLERQDAGKGKIKFVNIASDNYNPSKNMGIEYEEAMRTIHVLRRDGEVIYGTEALRTLFDEVGLGWAANLSASPFMSWVVDLIYNFLSANRIKLSGAFGGVFDAIIAAKRVEMSKEGVASCGDLDEECKVEW